MLLLILGSFGAGMLTILSPCVFPFLPVIIGGSIDQKFRRRPFVITLSLALTIILVTLFFKGLTQALDIPNRSLRDFSVVLLIVMGIFLVFPETWDKISYKLGFSSSSAQVVQNSSTQKGLLGEILIGISLGPAFASCSPVYSVILAQVLPASLIEGVIYLSAYSFGLGFIMLLIALLGDKLVKKLKWAVNPQGNFRKILGGIFIIIALLLYFNLDKEISAELLKNDWYLDFQERFIFFENDVARDLVS